MPLFPRIDVRNIWRPQTLSELDAEMDMAVGGRPTFAGVNVNEQTAMSYLGVYSCVRVRAETLGMLSLHLYQREGEGARRATEHPLYEMIHDAPNGEMVSSQWRETESAHYDTWGNTYSLIDIAQRGRNAGFIQQIYPFKPDRMTVYRDAEDGRLRYKYRKRKADGTETEEVYTASQVLHIPGLSYDGLIGYSPIAVARQAIGLGLATEEFGARFFGQGTHTDGVVTYPEGVTEQQIGPVREMLHREYAGLQKSHGIMVLSSGGEFKPITMPLEDAQFIAIRKFQLEESARLYRVPLHLIQNLDKATYNNIEQQMLEFVMLTMAPVCHKWEQYYNLKLLTREERRQGYYFKFDLNSLLRGDHKTRAEFYEKMRMIGAMNANEIRVKEEMNPRTDPGGDEYWNEGPSGQGQRRDAEARLRTVIADARDRVSRREAQDVLAAAQRYAKRGDETGWQAWLDSFCAEHMGFCARVFTPATGDSEAESLAISRVNALKSALSGLKCGDIDAINAALGAVSVATA